MPVSWLTFKLIHLLSIYFRLQSFREMYQTAIGGTKQLAKSICKFTACSEYMLSTIINGRSFSAIIHSFAPTSKWTPTYHHLLNKILLWFWNKWSKRTLIEHIIAISFSFDFIICIFQSVYMTLLSLSL